MIVSVSCGFLTNRVVSLVCREANGRGATEGRRLPCRDGRGKTPARRGPPREGSKENGMRLRSTAARALLALAPLATLATLARGGEEATPAPIAILAAMDAEAGPILSTIATPQTVTLRGIPCVSGTIDARRVVVVATGVGKVNAAMTTTLVIERFAPA